MRSESVLWDTDCCIITVGQYIALRKRKRVGSQDE